MSKKKANKNKQGKAAKAKAKATGKASTGEFVCHFDILGSFRGSACWCRSQRSNCARRWTNALANQRDVGAAKL